MSVRRPPAPVASPGRAASAQGAVRTAAGIASRPASPPPPPAAPSASGRRPSAAGRPHEAQPPSIRGAQRSSRRPGARTVLLLVVSVVSLASVVGPARVAWQQHQQLDALRTDLAARDRDVAQLEREVDRWDDPAYVSAQARSRLHLVLPGETGFVVVDGEGAGAAPAAGGRTSSSTPTPSIGAGITVPRPLATGGSAAASSSGAGR